MIVALYEDGQPNEAGINKVLSGFLVASIQLYGRDYVIQWLERLADQLREGEGPWGTA